MPSVVPGNMRRPEHFLCLLKTVISHMQSRLTKVSKGNISNAGGNGGVPESVAITPLGFIVQLAELTALNVTEGEPLFEFAHYRLDSLLTTLEVRYMHVRHVQKCSNIKI